VPLPHHGIQDRIGIKFSFISAKTTISHPYNSSAGRTRSTNCFLALLSERGKHGAGSEAEAELNRWLEKLATNGMCFCPEPVDGCGVKCSAL